MYLASLISILSINKQWYYTIISNKAKDNSLTKTRQQRRLPIEDNKPSALIKRLKEGLFIVLIAVALFIFLAFITFNNSDPSWANTGVGTVITNMGGELGAWLAGCLLYIFGYIAYFIPLSIAYSGWLILRDSSQNDGRTIIIDKWVYWTRSIGFVLTLMTGCGFSQLYLIDSTGFLPFSSGGILGYYVGPGLVDVLNTVGASVLLLAGLLSGITLFTGFSWLSLMDRIGAAVLYLFAFLSQLMKKMWQWYGEKRENARAVEPELIVRKRKILAPDNEESLSLKIVQPKSTLSNKLMSMQKKLPKAVREKNAPDKSAAIFEGSELCSLPPLSLLEAAQHSNDSGYSEEVLEQLSRLVETKLAEFGIIVDVVAVYPGPVITRFELELAPGVKVSKLTTLSKDIARSLSLVSVRIVEAIAGKSYVGIEIPNENRQMVRLSEVFGSTEYAQSQSALSLGLGVDIAGQPKVVDLEKMPHLLVAGTTGSGKSVGLNAMLLSLLYKSTPDMVRLILVDPKMLELSVYDGIPHLLTPVITDMKKAANSLRWSIAEMERRYQLMSALGVRNLRSYNEKVRHAEKSGKPLTDPLWEPIDGETAPHLEKLPNIVILIDEFADLMMVVGKKIDELIARLAQKARAAGIHLILATQRPSVDVITGLIKANIPTRIAFQVSSRIDSRTILDQQGAEQLLGHGDMLYMEAGMGQPIRIHGAFVADEEVHKVVSELKDKGKPAYLEEITEGGRDMGGPRANVNGLDFGDEPDNEIDELFDQAVDIVAKTRRASISNVQRRLKIGYNRAARILEQMEEQGMVTQMESNGSREVLLPPVDDE